MQEMVKPAYGLAELQRDFQAGRKLKYLYFWGHQPAADGRITASCLSQWWMADFSVDGLTFCCMEQYMMASKAQLFSDRTVLTQIMRSKEPKQMKALGRKVSYFDSTVWDAYKYGIVLQGNLYKFTQNPNLKAFLLSTDDKVLAEASPYDAIWGIKMTMRQAERSNPLAWKGENLLGFALMEVRSKLKK